MPERQKPLVRLWREPTLHFFALAAVILAGQRLLAGDPRTIELTPVLKADLLRRYEDQLSRPPTKQEADAFMADWKAEEALYREALREGIDRDDPTVRAVLVSKMRERVMLQMRTPEPTEADLQQYLAAHREQFESPLIYEYESVAFAKSERDAPAQRERAERGLTTGASAASLGLGSAAGNVDRARLDQEFGAEVAEKLVHLPPLEWQRLETADRLLLVKLVRVQGGAPPREELHARLLAAWKGEQAQKAMAEATRRIAERYRYEETSP